ncbi:MAG: NAD(P)-binding domain-containing protein [Nitrososphaerota archaeon]|nr:NAD(P)-binding domain-containing protein [Nitrososphaerota archaeon]
MKVAIIGGTGKLGMGLAARLSEKLEVQIGSRDRSKAQRAAAQIPGVTGGEEIEVASSCDAAVLAIPYEAVTRLGALEAALADKLVISPVVPIKQVGGIFYYGLENGSAAEEVASKLRRSRIAAALHTVPSRYFKGVKEAIDVPVASNDKRTYEEAARMISSIDGVRPLYAGPLSIASTIEMLTPLLLNLAKLNGVRAPSLKFVS